MSSDEPNAYELLELTVEATEADIRRAYRQRSLKLHPDKNPDNPDAPRLFHELRQGYELLLDPLRRMALDAKMRLAAAKKERYKSYDVKRKAMFADLEEREAAFKRNRAEKDQKERTRWTENERIKEEGRKMREARQKRTQEAEDTRLKPDTEVEELSEDEPPQLGSLDTTVRLKYPLATYPSLTTSTALTGLLASFGAVDTSTVVLSMKPSKKAPGKPPKHATALIPFTSIAAAFAAVGASGRADRGVQGVEITWAGGSEPPLIGWLKKKGMLSSGDVQASAKGKSPPPTSAAITPADTTDTSFSSFPTSFPTAVPPADSIPGVDFESLTLMRMRQAERERLEREILAQEAADV